MHGLGTLFGSLLGFAAAALPQVFQMFNDAMAHRRCMEKKAADATNPTPPPDAPTPTDDGTVPLGAEPDYYTGHVALQFLRSSVRPLITYGFFVLFATIKLCALTHALHVEHTPVATLLPVLWDEETQSLFAAVVAFWFGSRTVASMAASKPSSPSVAALPKGTGVNGTSIVGE